MLSSSAKGLGAAAIAALVAACSGEVVEQAGGGSGPVASSSTTVEPTPTTDTASGGGGAGAGGAPSCMPVTAGAGGFVEPTCADLGVMTVTTPSLTDDSADGKLSYLEKATLTVQLNEVAGVGFNFYPGVRFTSESISIPAPDNAWFYAILPCQSNEASTPIELLTDLPKGTIAHVKAQVAMLGADCPEAPFIDIPIQIE